MGDWASSPAAGGGGAQLVTDPDEKAQWASWLNGVYPSETTFVAAINSGEWTADFATQAAALNVRDEMIDASRAVGGSPYADIASYDPANELSELEEARDFIKDNILDAEALEARFLEAVQEVTDALTDTTGLYDQDEITALVGHADTASKITHMRNIDRLTSGMFDQRAIFNTQLGSAIAGLELARNQELKQFEYRLRLAQSESKERAVIALTGEWMRAAIADVEIKRAYLAAMTEWAKVSITINNDRIALDSEYEGRDALWNLDLFAYGSGVIASAHGGVLAPRPPTKGERLIGLLGNTASMAINTGLAIA